MAVFTEKQDLYYPEIAQETAIRYSIERLEILLTGRYNCYIIAFYANLHLLDILLLNEAEPWCILSYKSIIYLDQTNDHAHI